MAEAIKPLWVDGNPVEHRIESFKNHSFYSVYNTYSQRNRAAFPPLDHQKHGPLNCLPFWQSKSQKIHKNVTKVGPRRLPKSL